MPRPLAPYATLPFVPLWLLILRTFRRASLCALFDIAPSDLCSLWLLILRVFSVQEGKSWARSIA